MAHFKAIATDNSGKTRSEYLDSTYEVQEFAAKCIQWPYDTIVVERYDESGFVQATTFELRCEWGDTEEEDFYKYEKVSRRVA
jgi:hypothetical protein